MRYLTIAADYTQSGLRDDFEGPIQPEDLQLSAELCKRLKKWNDAYRCVIPLDDSERQAPEMQTLINSLDAEGQQLAAEVSAFVEGGAKDCFDIESITHFKQSVNTFDLCLY